MNREQRIEYLKMHLKKGRFRHSLAVEAEAARLAERFGLDAERAARAGLIHDAAKNMPIDEQLSAIRADGFEMDEFFALSEPLYHGPAGAYVARTRLGETDEEVLDAIRYHTVPSLEPRPLAVVLLIADMIEPERDYPGVRQLRLAAKENLEEAFLLALASPMVYELGRRHIVHPNSLIVYNRLLALKSRQADGTIMKKEE